MSTKWSRCLRASIARLPIAGIDHGWRRRRRRRRAHLGRVRRRARRWRAPRARSGPRCGERRRPGGPTRGSSVIALGEDAPQLAFNPAGLREQQAITQHDARLPQQRPRPAIPEQLAIALGDLVTQAQRSQRLDGLTKHLVAGRRGSEKGPDSPCSESAIGQWNASSNAVSRFMSGGDSHRLCRYQSDAKRSLQVAAAI